MTGIGVRRWNRFSLNEILFMERMCVVWEEGDGPTSQEDNELFVRLKKEVDIEKQLRALERDMQSLEANRDYKL